ncbi:unnamed protein product [Danaus chrysippus]|uniref:(African queen) hypothetical protein n=1 Tax=Danaus chrysippus TaxID=151541 RepID=A0A8J2W1U2_9NEOP|nr:unnamed protein product [Danaus chrysippus]
MEDPDFQSSNLCTTEDAFEKFQAVTMYEEDEFITLSDIISPPHTNPDQDVSEILNDVQIDEVPMSIQDEKTENNSKVPLASNQAPHAALQTNNSEDTTKISAPKRRGRKKRVPVENSNTQPILTPSELNKTKTKRRSRKQQSPKESALSEDLISDKQYTECNSDDIKETKHVSTKVPANSAKRKSQYSLAEKEETNTYKKMYKKGKRGRKPKHNKEEEELNEEKNSTICNITIENKDIGTKISLIAMKNKQKKGRKQYRLNNKSIVSPDIDTPQCEDKLSTKISISKESNENKESDPPDSFTSNMSSECDVTKNSGDTNNRKDDTIINNQNEHTDKNDITEEDMEEIPLSNLSRNSENNSNKNVQSKTVTKPKNSKDLGMDSKVANTQNTVTPVKKRGRPRKVINRSPTKMLLEEKRIPDDENMKCDKNNVNLQQNQNNYDGSKANCEIESDLPQNSDENIKEINNDDIVNTNTEISEPQLSSMKLNSSDSQDNGMEKDTPEDNSITEPTETNENITEDSSRRPVRRRVLKTWNYDEGSDEDPYANMESSDDEPRRRKKGGRYYSDDEYFPGDKRQLTETESDNAMDEDELGLEEPRKQKKKKNKKLDTSNKSPRKRVRKSDAESTCPTEKTTTNTDSRDVDFENCSDSLTIQDNGDLSAATKPKRKNKSQGETSEFANFIAKIVQGTDIKISKKSVDDVKTPLQIPVLDANDVNKSVDKCSQTRITKTKSESAQTDTLYEIPMKEQVPLTAEQSEKACDFLSSIVQTTAELGQLMTQKSNDFINKKINTRYVTDTFKMDYCVKKSFLLFKLAKHNLVQMEEDLSKQYEVFLKENNLIQHREEPKIITSTSKASDSDCEIVEEPIATKAPVKAAFNLKTVFLNKELSIKIAKKPSEEPPPKKKLNIKGRSSVWINDSVVVKKIKPNQSFLAQDSRNKKPPDCKITLEMVNNFFRNYERQQALLLCAPYIKTEWFGREKKYICNYFVDSTIDFPEKTVIIQNENIPPEIALIETNESNHLTASSRYLPKHTYLCPETLTSLCTKVLQNCLHSKQNYNSIDGRQKDLNRHKNVRENSNNLNFHNFEGIAIVNDINRNVLVLKNNCFESVSVQPLKTLCFKRVLKLMSKDNMNGAQSKQSLGEYESEKSSNIVKKTQIEEQLKPLFSLCFKKVEEMHKNCMFPNITYKPEALKTITLSAIQRLLNESSKTIDQHLVKNICHETKPLFMERNCYKIKTLLQMCLEVIDPYLTYSNYNKKPFNESSKQIQDINIEEPKYQVKSLLQLCKEKLDIVLDKSTNKEKTDLIPKECDNFKLEKSSSKVKTLSQLSIQILNDLLNKHIKVKTFLKLCPEEKNCDMAETINNLREQNKNFKLENNCCELKIKVKTSSEPCKESSEERNYVSKTQFISSMKNEDEKLKTKCNLNQSSLLLFNESSNNTLEKNNKTENDEETRINIVKSLKSLCYDKILESGNECLEDNSKQCETNLNITINNVNTVSEDIFSMANEDELDDDFYDDNFPEARYPIENEECPGVEREEHYEDIEDVNNWESQVKMELRSCLDSTSYNESGNQDQNPLPVRIKVEPLDDVSENIVDSTNIKTEPTCDQECMDEGENFCNSNIMPKVENVVKPEIRNEHTFHRRTSYDEDVFEAFVSSNKMMANLNSYGSTSSEIFSQSSQRIRRQHEPDSDGDIDAFNDSLNLLVPQNVAKSKVRLLESSSEEKDEEDSRKNDKKKNEKRKCKLKKSSKDLQCKTKTALNDDVAVITKQLRDNIRQGLNRNESSDSESDDFDFKTKQEKPKPRISGSENEKQEEKEIQCNDVDSTEFISEKKCSETQYEDPYEENGQDLADTRPLSPHSDSNQPNKNLKGESFRSASTESATKNIKNDTNTSEISEIKPYLERHGWKCYSIDSKDEKIYEQTYVILDKLPESFVKTSFQYQDLPDQDRRAEDLDFDRLTNLKTLQRVRKIGNKEDVGRPPTTNVTRTKLNSKLIKKSNLSQDNESIESTIKHEPCNELIPSEDESETLRQQFSSVPTQSSENNFAKDLLMDDGSNSDNEKPLETKDIKEELKTEEQTYTTRSGRTVKCKIETDELRQKDELMLTADKMMNKELALLHAPVTLKHEDCQEDSKEFKEKCHNKSQKNTSKAQLTRHRIESEDDSSSEEQKQWFTTKEKLLKRLSKKNDDTDIDDAKRAKIVNEFIEKRGEMPETRPRIRNKRRSNKNKINERRKQLKVLSRELFGVDSGYTKKYSQANTSKGRRNIRKVKDKKLLARSTVVANMAEFERKRRLSIRQAQLREVLGCEEDVRVVVINDELCLEYDFYAKRPVVSVHPFFTKVMKAHQYEGVKFMWDACFETVAMTSSGVGGGGCILAHCMGLGKTLQVLALLHTVLTHPQLGMRRVLVCCPLSTVLNWVDEIHKWIGPVTNQIKVFELSKLKKTYERAYQLEDWYNGGGIFIIGYELFRSLSTLDHVLDGVRPKILNKIRTALLDPGPDIIVCDEGHLLKNDCSILAVAMSRVVTKRRIVLTGTPMQNNLREYYCMVNFVKPNLLGSYSEYSNRFENPIMNGQHRDSSEEDIKLMKARTHILHKVLEGCLQRQEASVLYPYLPKKYEYTVFISLTKCQWELYKHYLTNCAKDTKQSVLKDFHVLQKVWTHPQVLHNFLTKTRADDKETKVKVEKLEDDLEESPEHVAAAAEWFARTQHSHELNELDSSNKFLVVFRLLHECVQLGDKVLIFSTSLYTMDALEFFLRRDNKWSLGRDYYRLDGSVPAEVRQKWCREFNAPHNTHTKLFLMSTRAGSLGLNMTAANRVIIMDTSWNPAHDMQSIFRVYRFGQKKDCYIYRLVAMGTMEQKIYERSVTKQAVACRVVDEQQIERHYNMAELSELYRLDEDGSGVCAGLAAGVRDAALLRVAAQGGAALHAVHEHDSLLRGSSDSVLPEHERNAAWMQFQQEHGTTHIQNVEINVPIKNEEDLTNQPIEEEGNEKDGEPIPAHNDTNKKTNKKKTKTKKQEPQPSTSQQELNPELEGAMIKKIMNILIQHNFHTMKTLQEISELVKNVRDVVANSPKNGLQHVDPLIASIARVLIEADNKPLQDNVKNEHVDDNGDKSSDDTDITLTERKRRKKRRDSDEEYTPDTRKRKTYIRIKKQNDSCNTKTTNDSTENTVTENTGDTGCDMPILKGYLDDNSKEADISHKTFEPSKEDSDVDKVFIQVDDYEENTERNKINTQVDKEKEMHNEINEIEEDDSSNECIEVIDDCDNNDVNTEGTSEAINEKEPIESKESIVKKSLKNHEQKTKKQPSTEKSTVIKKESTKKLINNQHKEKTLSKKLLKQQDTTKKPTSTKESVASVESKNKEEPKKKSKNKQPIKLYRNKVLANKDAISNESIILSDDDEPVITELITQKLSQGHQSVKKTSEKQTQGNQNVQKSSERQTQGNQNVQKSSGRQTQGNKNVHKSSERQTQGNEKVQKTSETQTLGNQNVLKSSQRQTEGNQNVQKSSETQTQGNQNVQKSSETQTQGNENVQKSSERQTQGNENVQKSSEMQTQGNQNVLKSSERQTEGNQNVQKSSKAKSILDDEQPIPLHESVLTNKNFITLVARTYLTGNPMLDEDAATLAAQYSTLKALKEVQASGNGLTSGPIYDIALQILGKDLIKRLNNANPKINTAENFLQNTAQLQDHLKGKDDKGQKNNEDKNKTLSKKITDEQKNTNELTDVAEEVASSKQSETSAKVVPVGIFKGPAAASNQVPSEEESILPDEDEVILSSSPISTPKRYVRKNSKELIVTAVSSEEARVQEMTPTSLEESRPDQTQSQKVKTTAPSTTSNIEADQNKNDSPAKKNTTKDRIQTEVEQNNKKDVPSQASSETICLDSDDDDQDKTQEKMVFKSSNSRTLIIRPTDKKRTGSESKSKNILVLQKSGNKTLPLTTVATAVCSEKPVKTSSQSKVNNNTPSVVTKTKCDAGDIIRINESGKVEILKRVRPAVTAKNKVPTATSARNNDNGTKTSLTSTPSSIKPQTSDNPKQSLFKERLLKIQPPGGRRRDESDPLSVIRNAVFIPAVTDEKTKQTIDNISKYTSRHPPKVPLKTKCNDNQASKIPQESSERNYSQAPKISWIDVNKDVIDLTDVNSHHYGNIKTYTKTTVVDLAGPSNATVTKKIATITKLDKASKRETVTSKPIQSPSSSKRSSSWTEGASKKLKAESKKQMTLSDFNLDDFDDIIELE